MNEPSLFTRLWFAWVCALRVLFDGSFAGRVWAVRDAMPEPKGPVITPPPAEQPKAQLPEKVAPAVVTPPVERPDKGALLLLELLQREGRFVDFLEEEIASFSDAEVGAAARLVHLGCRKTIREHLPVAPVRGEPEGAKVEIPSAFDHAEIKLSGDVKGAGPYRGTLQHRGWRVKEVKLPTSVRSHESNVIAPAEVEL